MMINRLWILLCLLLTCYAAIAQDTKAIIDDRLVARYVKNINSRADRLGHRLDKHSARVLRKFQKREAEIKRKMVKIDSSKTMAVFGYSEDEYQQLEQRLPKTKSIQYIPAFDTLTTTLKFLQKKPQLISMAKESDRLKGAVFKVNELGSKFEQADEIEKFLKERKRYLKDQLQNFGIAKEFKKLNKQAYYYCAQMSEYKSILNDHKKAERKVIEILRETKMFREFMRKNSMLASLFRLPGDPDDPVPLASLSGLQTRAQVNSLIQQQIGTNGQARFHQNMQDAQSQLQQLKNRVSQFGSSSSDGDPDSYQEPENFKPNEQKTRSFLKRLEYGTNIQSQKASNFFPVTSDIGLSVGYKLNDKSVIGLGASYKIGWGNGWKNISITNQGISLRSFINWKLKGSFWLSGGYEHNYKTAFKNIGELRDQSAWQQSGLAGFSKVVSMKTKFFKKTKLQVLWDFLSYQQVPGTQPVIFRIEYCLQ